jgi:nitrogen regulatory protein P-II 1
MRFKLIMTMVNPDITEDVVQTAKNAGATGDVIIPARGSGVSEARFFGVSIVDKTDIILFVVEEHSANKVLDAITKECKLCESGRGIALMLSVDKVAGLENQILKIKDRLKGEQL